MCLKKLAVRTISVALARVHCARMPDFVHGLHTDMLLIAKTNLRRRANLVSLVRMDCAGIPDVAHGSHADVKAKSRVSRANGYSYQVSCLF